MYRLIWQEFLKTIMYILFSSISNAVIFVFPVHFSFQSHSCSKEFISYQETYVLCLYNGTCDWHFPAILTSTCKVDVRYFPFDIQLCDLTFGAWSADVTMVRLSFLCKLYSSAFLQSTKVFMSC